MSLQRKNRFFPPEEEQNEEEEREFLDFDVGGSSLRLLGSPRSKTGSRTGSGAGSDAIFPTIQLNNINVFPAKSSNSRLLRKKMKSPALRFPAIDLDLNLEKKKDGNQFHHSSPEATQTL